MHAGEELTFSFRFLSGRKPCSAAQSSEFERIGFFLNEFYYYITIDNSAFFTQLQGSAEPTTSYQLFHYVCPFDRFYRSSVVLVLVSQGGAEQEQGFTQLSRSTVYSLGSTFYPLVTDLDKPRRVRSHQVLRMLLSNDLAICRVGDLWHILFLLRLSYFNH